MGGVGWAILIGISSYQDQNIQQLNYAHRDAEELYDFLRTPSGGYYTEDHIRKLVNEQATTREISRLLRSFLKQPAVDDHVLIYLSCHGAPDRDRPQDLYFLTYDTEHTDIAGTALPMRELDIALRETLHARHVVVIADTCHSGGIDLGMRKGETADPAATLRAFSEELGKAKASLAVLSSAAPDQSSRESPDWGGGHGVFTHYLLQGLRSEAANPRDGKVRIQPLYQYILETVMKATANAQQPWISGHYDPHLVMAIVGGAEFWDYYQLGRHLYDLGLRLADPRRFEAAIRQYDAALQLPDNRRSLANLHKGIAQFALGAYAGAIASLHLAQEAWQNAPEPTDADDQATAHFYLGLAHVRTQEYPQAIASFETFLRQTPQDGHAPWIAAYLAQLKPARPGKKYALLIGTTPRRALPEVGLMKEALIQACGFDDEDIVILAGAGATRQSILDEFAALNKKAAPDNTIVVFFSVFGFSENVIQVLTGQPASQTDAYFVVPAVEHVGLGNMTDQYRQLLSSQPTVTITSNESIPSPISGRAE
jgi:uncharacterized caspase-like protein